MGVERPMPDDFREHAGSVTMTAAQKRWSAGYRTLTRWYSETGIIPLAYTPPPPKPRPKKQPVERVYHSEPPPADFATMAIGKSVEAMRRHYGRGDAMIRRWFQETGTMRTYRKPGLIASSPSAPLPQADASLVGRAAHYLRKWGPVFRANIATPKAEGYVLWGRRVSDTELLDKAKARGWDANEWRRVA